MVKCEIYNEEFQTEFWQERARKSAITRSHYQAKDGLNLDSSWEVIVYNYCLDYGLSIERNIPLSFIDSNNIQYITLIDFKINNKLYEVKGNHLLEGCFKETTLSMEDKLKIYADNDVTIITTNIQKYINEDMYKNIKFIDINNFKLRGDNIWLV